MFVLSFVHFIDLSLSLFSLDVTNARSTPNVNLLSRVLMGANIAMVRSPLSFPFLLGRNGLEKLCFVGYVPLVFVFGLNLVNLLPLFSHLLKPFLQRFVLILLITGLGLLVC